VLRRIALTLALLGLLPTAAEAACDDCKDLCRLIDQYQQKEKGIEIWKQYAWSTPAANRKALPAGVNDVDTMEAQGMKEFDAWTADRTAKNEWPCPLKPGGAPGAVVDLTTSITSDCTISYKGKKLEGQNLKDFETDKGCEAEADAVIAHETVHQIHCTEAWSKDPKTAAKFLDTPEMVAETELQAWTAHKKVLADEIRKLLKKKGCGWQPTYRQQASPDAVPSQKQLDKMRTNAWKAAKALPKKKAGP
jgi:hypothetical protein